LHGSLLAHRFQRVLLLHLVPQRLIRALALACGTAVGVSVGEFKSVARKGQEEGREREPYSEPALALRYSNISFLICCSLEQT
jgi:hypothetical protein